MITRMHTTIRMVTETTVMPAVRSPAALMQLMWLASPALPVGGFSYSEGLESAVAKGWVHDASTASRWLCEQLQLSQARGDLSVLAAFISAWRDRAGAGSSPQTPHDHARNDHERLSKLNQWVQHTRESAELRLQTEQMGRSLLDWLRPRQWARDDDLALCQRLVPTYPMVMGLALSCVDCDVASALQAYAFGWAENMTQAAIKSVPLGQSAGQAILSDLHARIEDAVQDALSRDDDTRQSYAPMLAILSAQHETQYSRLFRS